MDSSNNDPTINILVSSESELKLKTVKEFFDNMLTIDSAIHGYNCDSLNLPQQPINSLNSSVYQFAMERFNYVKSQLSHNELSLFNYVISIENGIDYSLQSFPLDICYVIIYDNAGKFLCRGKSYGIPVPSKTWNTLVTQNELVLHSHKIQGYSTTIGDILHKEDITINPKNWVKTVGQDRTDQIKNALSKACNIMQNYVKQKIVIQKQFKCYPDYPKPGILFKDMFPLLANGDTFHKLIDFIVTHYKTQSNFSREFDCVVGLESRGFCLGTALAYCWRKGFVPVRKAGKLPGKVYSVSYEKEYGTDTCEIQCESIQYGQRVLIIDDLVATGGSLQAAVELVEKCGGVVADCCVLIDVPELKELYTQKIKAPLTILLK
jgi:adenine phosphoribosyltransferase